MLRFCRRNVMIFHTNFSKFLKKLKIIESNFPLFLKKTPPTKIRGTKGPTRVKPWFQKWSKLFSWKDKVWDVLFSFDVWPCKKQVYYFRHTESHKKGPVQSWWWCDYRMGQDSWKQFLLKAEFCVLACIQVFLILQLPSGLINCLGCCEES